jgi:hypothetical protein
LPSGKSDFEVTEFTTGEYQAIESDGDSYKETANPGDGEYLYQKFLLLSSISSENVTSFTYDITVVHAGKAQGGQKYLLKPQAKGVKVKFKNEVVKSEDTVKKECVDWLKTLGYHSSTVYLGGIPVGGGKLAPNPLKGFPDTIVTNPFTTEGKRIFFIEYKKSHGGILAQEQLNWHDLLQVCGLTVFVISSLEQAKQEIGGYLK